MTNITKATKRIIWTVILITFLIISFNIIHLGLIMDKNIYLNGSLFIINLYLWQSIISQMIYISINYAPSLNLKNYFLRLNIFCVLIIWYKHKKYKNKIKAIKAIKSIEKINSKNIDKFYQECGSIDGFYYFHEIK